MDDIYGIDLGTTNSLIGLGDKLLSGLVPSIVDLDEKTVGEINRKNPNATRSFKVNMSTAIEGTKSVVASSWVLRELVKQAGGNVKKVVISVPAYFKDNQRQATIKAAEEAGLEVVSLINEPTAAAMYISKTTKKLSLVYDLGGGTFDVSVIDSRFDNYDVQATDGIVLGGDDLDKAIFKFLCSNGKIKLHHISKEDVILLQLYATELKLRMQKERHDIECDLSRWGVEDIVFKESQYKALMKLTFGQTISKTRDVISEAIPVGEVFDLVLVGGSTRCPYLREWLEEEIGVKPVELTYDPDRVVAQGACLYAQLIAEGKAEVFVSDVTTALSIGQADGTVRVIIDKNSKLPISNTVMMKNNDTSSKLMMNIYQGDSALASGNEKIGTVVFDYGEVKLANEGIVIIGIEVNTSGVITFTCKELMGEEMVVVLDRNI